MVGGCDDGDDGDDDGWRRGCLCRVFDLSQVGWFGLVGLLPPLLASLVPLPLLPLLLGYLNVDDCCFFRGGGGGVAGRLEVWKGDFRSGV